MGKSKLTSPLIEYTKLHIALSQDGIRFSIDNKCQSKWNCIFIISREFGVNLEDSSKVLAQMLADVKEKISVEVSRLLSSKVVFD